MFCHALLPQGDSAISPEEMKDSSKEMADLRKKAGLPVINPDAKPSSIAQKMQTCLTTRLKKLNEVKKMYTDVKDADKNDNQKRNLCNIAYPCCEVHSGSLVGSYGAVVTGPVCLLSVLLTRMVAPALDPRLG